jgi:hypothetical protein
MTRYSLRLRSVSRFPRSYNSTLLTEEVLREAVPAVTGILITPFADGYDVAVDLERRDHVHALNDLASTFHQLGYSAVQATMIEFATSWLEGGTLGTIGGAALGTATKSVEGFLTLTLIGFLTGMVAGGTNQYEKARYQATPTTNGWHITSIEPPAAPGVQPASAF